MSNGQVSQYIRVPSAKYPHLRFAYTSSLQEVQDYLDKQLPQLKGLFTVTSRPSADWELVASVARVQPTPVDYLVIPVRVDESALEEFRKEIIAADGESAVGADLSAGAGEYWCPLTPDQPLFGNRLQARDLIHAEVLGKAKLDGANVNVVVVDRGLDKTFTPNFQGGWKHTNPYVPTDVHLPGMTVGEEAVHGRMMVRNIHDLAPKANFWDMPLIPPRIWDIPVFINDAQAAFDHMLKDIRNTLSQQWPGPWILVNPWAIFDRRSERPPGDYTNGPKHPFNMTITQAVMTDGHDVVFCAGNCGQFCPDDRCGPQDIGPGQDVLGANSHPNVVSVGAVRVDARWLGYSSQGPGQPKMWFQKPDLCAPSGFAETGDDYTGNTGTSAASGVAAGAIAALRTSAAWAPGLVPPNELRRIFNGTARKTEGPHWNERLGHGILDLEATVAELTARFP